MYKVELYVRVRRACMVEGMSTREAARVFGPLGIPTRSRPAQQPTPTPIWPDAR